MIKYKLMCKKTSLLGARCSCIYPSKILGFIKISGTPEAIIQCSEKPLIWSDVEKNLW